MRKITILLLALVMVASIFVSCDTAVEETVAGNDDADVNTNVVPNTNTEYNFVGTWISSYDYTLEELTEGIVLQSGSLFPEPETTESTGAADGEPTEAPSEEPTEAPSETEPTEPAIDISEFTDKIDGYMNGGKLTIDFLFMDLETSVQIPPAAPDISYTLVIDADKNYTMSVDKVRYDKMVDAYAGVMVENAKILAAAEGKTYEQVIKAAKFGSHDEFVKSIKDSLVYGYKLSADGKSYTTSGKWVFDGTYVTFDDTKYLFNATNDASFDLENGDTYLYFDKAE